MSNDKKTQVNANESQHVSVKNSANGPPPSSTSAVSESKPTSPPPPPKK